MKEAKFNETERKKELELGKVGPQDDIVSSFLSLRDDNGEPLLVEKEIVDNIITLLFASHDDFNALEPCYKACSSRFGHFHQGLPRIEQKEIKEAKDGKLSWGEVQMMNYTWKVAQERLRLTPPVFGNFRYAFRDTTFGGFVIYVT